MPACLAVRLTLFCSRPAALLSFLSRALKKHVFNATESSATLHPARTRLDQYYLFLFSIYLFTTLAWLPGGSTVVQVLRQLSRCIIHNFAYCWSGIIYNFWCVPGKISFFQPCKSKNKIYGCRVKKTMLWYGVPNYATQHMWNAIKIVKNYF